MGNLILLEQNPQLDNLITSTAPVVIPLADVLANSDVTLFNRTFNDLIALRSPTIPTSLTSILTKGGVGWEEIGCGSLCYNYLRLHFYRRIQI